MFFTAVAFFCSSSLNAISLKCVPMSIQEYKMRPKIININSNEPSFYPYNVKINKYSGKCTNINDSYAKLYVPDVAKNINVWGFNLMWKTNE